GEWSRRPRATNGRAAYERSGLAQSFGEAKAGSFAVRLSPDLDLVGDRPDDRDPEPALRQFFRSSLRLGEIESSALVGHFDHQPVRQELIRALDDSCVVVAVRVADGVR